MFNRYETQEISEVCCPACVSEDALVTVPVAVRGYANIGNVSLKCGGPFVVTRNSDVTPGAPNAVSEFTVSQRIHVDIPIAFGAEARVGEGHCCYDSSMDGYPYSERYPLAENYSDCYDCS